MMQRTQRIEEFLNTRQLSILNMPTTLADIFEYMAAVDENPQVNTDSVLWYLLGYL
jgi:hypothetical protein